jgi:allantoate deiminase
MDCSKDRIRNDIEAINAFNATPGDGVTRLTWTPEYASAYRYVVNGLKQIGAQVAICRAGCIRGRLPGDEPFSPAVMSGSHIDTALNGGRFDGVVGTVTALEAARVVVENNIPHRHPIDVVVFPEEEGSGFGIVLGGSSLWTGGIDPNEINRLTNAEGLTFDEAMRSAGVVVEDDSILRPDDVKAMLEVHIEQSVVLDRENISIGVIESIAGLKWFDLVIEGTANHAGGTPMTYRRDALQGAVRIIAGLEDMAANKMGPNTVGTCGAVQIIPGAVNVIPGRVKMTFDLRDSEAANLRRMPELIRDLARTICRDRELGFQMTERANVEPVIIPRHMISLINQNADKREIKTRTMMSGALHDACKLADITDIGMIFVPSKDGRSHCPEEWTDLEDIKRGADVLLDTIVRLAE